MQNCYNTGKVPRKKGEDQEERLTTKHIQTLSFLQEIVNENKALKARVSELEDELGKCGRLHEMAENAQIRIKELQQQYLDRADEINRMLTEKHREEMMQKVEEGVEIEKKWANEKHGLLEELEKVRRENNNLRAKLDSSQQGQGQMNSLHQKMDKLQKEIDKVRADNKRLEAENGNQVREIQRLQFVEDKNLKLTDEVTEATQMIKELEFRLSKLQRDAGSEGAAAQDELMNTLRARLQKLHKEKSLWEEREREYKTNTDDLKAEILKLRKALADSERMRGEMHVQLDEVIKELNLLRSRTSNDRDNQTFRDFVKVKRELVQVKEENEELRTRLKLKKGAGGGNKGDGVLPRIDGDGASSKGAGKKDSGWRDYGKR